MRKGRKFTFFMDGNPRSVRFVMSCSYINTLWERRFMKAKLRYAFAVAIFLFVTSGVSFAADVQPLDPGVSEKTTLQDESGLKPSPILNPRDKEKVELNGHLDFGFMYWHLDYKEDFPPPGKSTESGWLPGIYLGLDYNKRNSVYAKLFLEFSFGDDTYDGTTQTGIPISFSDNNRQFFFRGELDLGYSFAITKNISIKPYAGYGFRCWNRGQPEIRQISGMNLATFQEQYYWHYIPVGVAADFKISDRISIEPNGGARFMFYGKMTARFSDLDPGFNDPDVKLGNRIGYYAEIPVRYKFTKSLSVILKPWYAYDEIGQSDTVDLTYYGTPVATVYEPPSRTHQYGANVVLSVAY